MRNTKATILPILVIAKSLSCFATSEPLPTKVNAHLFILSGQSNMRQPLPEAFEGVVSRVFGKENVVVSTFSAPSQPIRQWCKTWFPPEGVDFQLKEGETNGVLYDRMLAGVRKNAGERDFSTVTFVWMQGEADGLAGWGGVYEKSFLAIIEQLKVDLKRDDIRFVLGRINDHQPNGQRSPGKEAVRAAQTRLGESYANGAWVDTDDLNTGINPWSVYEVNGEHFPNSGYRTLGQRLARTACGLIDPEMILDETILDAYFFESVEQIATHSAIGKEIGGSPPNGAGERLTSLTNGVYGEKNPRSKEWVFFHSEKKPVELIVDLDHPQAVSAVAANFLIQPEDGVGFPAKAEVSTSKDGQTYDTVSTHRTSGFTLQPKRMNVVGPEEHLVLFDIRRPEVRYIKLIFHPGTFSLALDEIVVNPKPKPKLK